MEIVKKITELNDITNLFRSQNKTVGYVPTMGGLHNGHLSLIEESKKHTDKTIVSIFVNPLQFNDKNDFRNYPRDIEKDIILLEKTSPDILFIPDYNEVYDNYKIKTFELGSLNSILEGEHRPGHFNGVANVVYRFFQLVKPDKAFFGKKDYQQVYVIKKIVKDTGLPVEIVECSIIRESDGLAMSSRNVLLGKAYREKVSIIYQTLKYVNENFSSYEIGDLKKYVTKAFSTAKLFQLEYFEFIDLESFNLIEEKEGRTDIIATIALHAGNVRLIDNININL